MPLEFVVDLQLYSVVAPDNNVKEDPRGVYTVCSDEVNFIN